MMLSTCNRVDGDGHVSVIFILLPDCSIAIFGIQFVVSVEMDVCAEGTIEGAPLDSGMEL